MQQERNTGMDVEGTRLGRYRLGREIGRGFSSIVYEAVDAERGRTVALKVLTFFQHLSADRREDLTERFAREARAISALAHPAIVAIYEFGRTDDGRWFTAMERLQGESLRSRLQQGGALAPEEALPVVAQIADALQYAHGRGIVHRDVKPDNIFLLPDGRAKLMDFGVAHVLADQALTRTGTIVGSPAYMSPEQINGQTLDGRSDVFSLGVTLAEMLAGVKPFDAPTVPAVMHRILNRPPQLSAISPWALRRLVGRALAKNRAARFGSAALLADALRRQGGLGVTVWEPAATLVRQSVPLPLAYRSAPAPAPLAPPQVRPRPVPPLAGAAAVLAVVAMSAWPILAHRRQPVTTPVVAGQAHTIPLVWRRVSAVPTRAAVPVRVPVVHRSAVRIVEIVPTPAHPLPPAAPRQPLTPAAPSAPVRTWTPPRTARPGPQIARTVATTTAPALAPTPAILHRPVVRIAGEQQEQQDLTPQAPEALPPLPASDQDAAPRDIADAPPHLARRVTPLYPSSARAQGQEGTVTLRVSVDEDGAVADIEIVESSGARSLDRAALQAVRRWEYDPAFRDGAPVPGVTTERIVFRLD